MGKSKRMTGQSKEEKHGLNTKQDVNKSRSHSASHQKSRHREKRRKSRAERNKDRAQKQQQVLILPYNDKLKTAIPF